MVSRVSNRNLLRGRKLFRRCFHEKISYILLVIMFRILREIEILTESDEPFTRKDILRNRFSWLHA